MALSGFTLNTEKLSCSICLDPLKNPVTIPCGHSYCMECIKNHWDREERKTYSCPQCRQTFMPRPVLVRNTMLADLVDDMKKVGLQATPADHCYAGPEDVACDFCTDRKLKAFRSCLQCLVSYCEQHLKPHWDFPALKKHKLINPSKKLQENICPKHGELKAIFCRTDQQCICYLCSLDDHKDHSTISAAAERTERQKQLTPSQQKMKQQLQDCEKAVKLLQEELVAIGRSADKALTDSEKIFTELIRLIESRKSLIKQQIENQQKTEENRVKKLLEKLDKEVTELKGKDAELERLSQTEDHIEFLYMFPSLSGPGERTATSLPKQRTRCYFQDVTETISEVGNKVQSFLSQDWPRVSRAVANPDVLLPLEELTARAEFLKFSQPITLDPNTVNMQLVLSERNRKVTYRSIKQMYQAHSERFHSRSQVLSRETLTGHHYWEVEWSGLGAFIGVAYKTISRTGDNSEFGKTDKSWVLLCSESLHEFRHNNSVTLILGPQTERIGVYLDHRAGLLSFYSVSGAMSLLHRVQTTFTQPLCAAFRAHHGLASQSSAVFCEIK
ncbi:tripartite motif-containing protein 16-like [Xiphophorus hellerii]|uniref:tripartite motif-containing protein 16-like n=1 Tax=Xiphophorus hellerii TaxID=8084 RepID=UPI0013B3BD9A|nr:tripartite motif-containing protein 16-like [Xiphophorus hellerii]